MQNLSAPVPRSGAKPKRAVAVPGLAMAVIMATSGPLPASAATLIHRDRLGPQATPELLANQRSPFFQKRAEQDERDKNKKKNNKKTKSSKKDHKNNKSNKKDSNSNSRNRKLTNKERQRIYEQGREDGLEKGRKRGYNRGVEAGYQEGFDKGKDKGYRRGYNKGFDRDKQRKQWKSWNKNQWRDYNRSRRNVWVNPVRYDRGYYNNPGWARNSNWGYNRPWGGGWYNNSSNSLPWSWWAGQALGWGINALTTALIVNNAVNNAIRQQQPTVRVPQSNYNLYYGSVEPIDNTVVNFVVDNQGLKYQMQADCTDGLLNGEVPTTLAEAELINTACQITYGSI